MTKKQRERIHQMIHQMIALPREPKPEPRKSGPYDMKRARQQKDPLGPDSDTPLNWKGPIPKVRLTLTPEDVLGSKTIGAGEAIGRFW
jgi:hypothetical protein